MTEDKKQQNDTPVDTGEIKTEENQNGNSEVVENKEEKKDNKDIKSEDKNDNESKKDNDKKEYKTKRKFNTKRKGGFRKKRKFKKREKPEFEQKILSLRRVTRVVAGGRRFSFSAFVIIGNKQGKVGIGIGKSNDASNSIQKAVTNAKKNLVKIKLTENGSIPYDVQAKFKASEVIIRPIVGKGLAVGGAVRTVLELAGVKEGGGKILSRSKNHINNAQATLKALSPFTEKVEYVEKKFTRKKPFKKRRFIKRTNKKENK